MQEYRAVIQSQDCQSISSHASWCDESLADWTCLCINFIAQQLKCDDQSVDWNVFCEARLVRSLSHETCLDYTSTGVLFRNRRVSCVVKRLVRLVRCPENWIYCRNRGNIHSWDGFNSKMMNWKDLWIEDVNMISKTRAMISWKRSHAEQEQGNRRWISTWGLSNKINVRWNDDRVRWDRDKITVQDDVEDEGDDDGGFWRPWRKYLEWN